MISIGAEGPRGYSGLTPEEEEEEEDFCNHNNEDASEVYSTEPI